MEKMHKVSWTERYRRLSPQEKKNATKEFFINYALYMILGAMIICVIIVNPRFIYYDSLINILCQSSTRLIVALGAAGLIILQGTDLSAGRILGLSACISASLLQSLTYSNRMFPNLPQLPLFVPLLIVVIVGGALGAFNGFGVAKLKLHAFVVTLGSQLIVYGLILVYLYFGVNAGKPIGVLDDRFVNFVLGGITIGSFRVPYLIFYAAIVTGIMWFIWNKTKLGKNMFAVGGNPDAAAVSGVNLTSTIMLIFILSGILYGAAGFLESARIGSNSATTGTNYELDAIAACVIGGVSFFGGVGTIRGVIIGVVMLQLINAGLIFLSVDPSWQTIVKGAIIILACAVDVRKYLVRK